MDGDGQPALLRIFRRLNVAVSVVLLAFIFIYLTTVFCVIVPWLSFSVPGAANLAALTANTFLALYCYFCCIFLDPGRVPKDWSAPDEEQALLLHVKRKGGGLRVCSKCSKPKPPRAHHCRVCKRCVLRMDHHCPWVNNCIGHGNYKAFYLFLLYVTAAVMHSFGLLAVHAVHVLAAHDSHIIRTGPHALAAEELTDNMHLLWWWALLQTVAVGITMPLSLVLLGMLGLHTHLVSSNKTMIEFLEGMNAKLPSVPSELHSDLQHPYDMGICPNLHMVLGSNPGTWLLPPRRAKTGGTDFPTIWQRAEDGDHLVDTLVSC